VTYAFSAADKEDALREVINLGMGAAGAALAETLGVFVRLSVPALEAIDGQDVVPLLAAARWGTRSVSVSRQAFYGGLSGEALVLFDEIGCRHLADLLGHEGDTSGNLAEEVLLELGNAMVGACINGIADRLKEVVSFAPPALVCDGAPLWQAFATSSFTGRRTLLVCIDFSIEERQFESRIAIFISEKSLARLDTAVEAFLTELMDG
jgi:chemotaxis protein CheC